AHEHALEHTPCPQCGGELVLKHGKHGAFLGCNQYPQCDYVKPLHQNDGHIVKELGVACPECGNELVLRQGRYGMFVGCSHYPHCHHIEPINQPEPEQNSKALFA
ncbi:DNA topoisomerase family protein, partial [Vibrio vulnificus]